MAAALWLFGRDGFEQVSMEQVAQQAGVSRRTAYRHFPTKEDLVFDPVRRWFAILEDTVANREPDEATRDLCRRACMDIAASIQAAPQEVLDAFAIVSASQALLDRQGKANAEWVTFYASLVLGDTGDGPLDQLAALVAGSAIIGATSALFPVWSASNGEADLVEMTRLALDQIDSVWPDACR